MTELHPRKMDFHFDEAPVPFLWNPDNPAFSSMMNAVSFLAVGFEKMIIKLILQLRKEFADPEVAAEARRLIDDLTALADEAEDERQRELLAHLRSEVNAGSTFAKALGQFPREFADVYVAVVGAGFSGVMTAVHLLAGSNALRVILIERRARLALRGSEGVSVPNSPRLNRKNAAAPATR